MFLDDYSAFMEAPIEAASRPWMLGDGNYRGSNGNFRESDGKLKFFIELCVPGEASSGIFSGNFL